MKLKTYRTNADLLPMRVRIVQVHVSSGQRRRPEECC